MSKMKRLQESLFDDGIFDRSSEEIRQAKEAHTKARKRKYQKEFRQRHKRIEVSLDAKEGTEFNRLAKTSGLTKGKFILLCAKAYLDQRFVLFNKDLVSSLKQLVLVCRGCGNNVNQIARHVNSVKPRSFDPSGLYEQLNRMEDHIIRHLREPENILEYIQRKVKEFPHLTSDIQKIVGSKSDEHDN